MAKFTLEINLGNESMSEPYQIGGELVRIGKTLTELEMSNIELLYGRCAIRDINGNFVGYYEVS